MPFFKNNDEDKLIAQLQNKAQKEGVSKKYPVASAEVIALCEKFFGYKLPPLLRRVYSEVANGGIGPGGQLVGLSDGKRSSFSTKAYALDVLGVYDCFINYRLGWDEQDDYGDMLWQWQLGVLPVCDWGDYNITVIDCKARNPHMIDLNYKSSTTNYKNSFKKKTPGVFAFPGVPLKDWLASSVDNDGKEFLPPNWTDQSEQDELPLPPRPIVQVRRNSVGLTTD